ncbi:MAG TPA: tRNA pseudouridine(55) synthase TruB [Acidimicrobiales bacterium]|nr:tRNA pseudouridine(55) synthase TruB [Acidimicrobiales bacterium]
MTTNNGLLLMDKPRGVTSHDVVAHVRRVLNERRVGHAGTLDPMATGLLILGVGPSTRLLRFAQSEKKRYEGVLSLGVRTDSLDADGIEVQRAPVPALAPEVINEAIASLLGAQEQVPPMVSALKVNGRRLHDLAREGVVIDRAPRSITVHALSVTPLDDTHWGFEVTCSMGTYVRVLMSDLAERLGTLGHLSVLRRAASGDHEVRDALTYDDFEHRVSEDIPVLLAPSAFVEHLPHVRVSEDEERRVRMGQRLALDEPGGDEIAAIAPSGHLVGVLRRRGDLWQPDVVMPATA